MAAGDRTQPRAAVPPTKTLASDEATAFLATDLFAKRCRKLAALFSTVEEVHLPVHAIGVLGRVLERFQPLQSWVCASDDHNA